MSTTPIIAPSVASKTRNYTADALRGLASLAVCWYHFTHGNPTFLPPGFLKSSGNLGWVGVEVFFVISGYAMMVATRGSSASARDYGRFMGKRMLRLHPPYIAAIVLILLLNWASAGVPGYNGLPFDVTAGPFLAHLVYLVPFFGYAWYNPVFWTLCIEVQWYLLIAVVAGVLHSQTAYNRRGMYLLLLAAAFLTKSDQLLFRYLPLFSFGVAAYQYRARLINRAESAAAVVLAGLVSLVVLDPTITVAGAITAGALAFVHITNRGLLWLGGISYSLYLLHVPIGGRIINLAERLPRTFPTALTALAAAVGASIAAAYLLWRFVEAPAHRAAQAFGRRDERVYTVTPARIIHSQR